MKKKVFVGISGGVDSSVSGFLLKEQGYDVTGVFLKNWSGEEFGVEDQCPWKEDLEYAKAVANHIDIPLLVYNFEKEYRATVIEDFFYQYSIGNTPNPDVLCNKYIKFDAFLTRALLEGADFIATGHYSHTQEGRLFKAIDESKDQTYFLHQLTNDQLLKSIFPVGKMLKNEVREIAKRENIPTATRKDSQGICFLGKIDVEEFLKTNIKTKEGDIVDIESNKIVGKHDGVWFYTIGQRKGIGIGGSDLPYFVVQKDISNNILFVCKGRDNQHLFKKRLRVQNLHIINNSIIPKEIDIQIRYHGEYMKAVFDDGIFNIPGGAWAPAIGQSLVIYQGKECLGGGNITEILD